MKNRIVVENCIVEKNRITVEFSAEGDCSSVFRDTKFFAEYNMDISSVPQSVAVVPFLANVLPISWIYDAEIVAPYCDQDFYDSIPDFKRGYEAMYPSISFQGHITVKRLERNNTEKRVNACFFSGGVDAFNTLIQHMDEKPILITLWGSDVWLDDLEGWTNVKKHLISTCREFQLDYVTVKTSFRTFLDEAQLSKMVASSGDGWWHGFQHGIGIYCHGAPAAYVKGIRQIYFASSFTAQDKGKVTCASDPTIDNFVNFCGAQIVHDGYECNRQKKVRNITHYAVSTGKKIPLRVCWESRGGGNCCMCEKCWRTVLAIYAENQDPREYGFHFTELELYLWSVIMRVSDDKMLGSLRYLPIQNEMQKNCNRDNLPMAIRWFYYTDFSTKQNYVLFRKMLKKLLQKCLFIAHKRGIHEQS